MSSWSAQPADGQLGGLARELQVGFVGLVRRGGGRWRLGRVGVSAAGRHAATVAPFGAGLAPLRLGLRVLAGLRSLAAGLVGLAAGLAGAGFGSALRALACAVAALTGLAGRGFFVGAGPVGGVAFAPLVGGSGPFLRRGVLPGAARAGAVGLLSAPFAAAARTIAGLVALRIGLTVADARRRRFAARLSGRILLSARRFVALAVLPVRRRRAVLVAAVAAAGAALTLVVVAVAAARLGFFFAGGRSLAFLLRRTFRAGPLARLVAGLGAGPRVFAGVFFRLALLAGLILGIFVRLGLAGLGLARFGILLARLRLRSIAPSPDSPWLPSSGRGSPPAFPPASPVGLPG